MAARNALRQFATLKRSKPRVDVQARMAALASTVVETEGLTGPAGVAGFVVLGVLFLIPAVLGVLVWTWWREWPEWRAWLGRRRRTR